MTDQRGVGGRVVSSSNTSAPIPGFWWRFDDVPVA